MAIGKLTIAAIAGFFTTAVGGCMSPAEIHALEQRECAGYGFEQGTDAFANCLMEVDQQRALRRAEAQEETDQSNLQNQINQLKTQQNLNWVTHLGPTPP